MSSSVKQDSLDELMIMLGFIIHVDWVASPTFACPLHGISESYIYVQHLMISLRLNSNPCFDSQNQH